MKANKTQDLTRLSILIALTIVLGYFVKINTLTGMLTFLDAGIYFTAFYLGAKRGAIVGGLSGFLLDWISGYPQWMLVSLIAHGSQGYFAGLSGKWRALGLIVASALMVGGYFVASILMFNLAEALAGLIGNIAQNTLGMIAGYLAYLAANRLGLKRMGN